MFSRSARYYDALYSWKDYAGESERLHALIQERVPGARTLLDVACGTGAHLELLRDRYDAEGLDLDPQLLEIARERVPDVPLHEGDMTKFDLGREFDAVLCLFSSIGYAGTVERLEAAVASMARHVRPGGVLLVEPWLTPERFEHGHFGALFTRTDEWAVARMNVAQVEGRVSVLDMHYLVAEPHGVEHFVERHELTLYTHDEYLAAFRAAGLEPEYDAEGLMDRGLYLGVKPAE